MLNVGDLENVLAAGDAKIVMTGAGVNRLLFAAPLWKFASRVAGTAGNIGFARLFASAADHFRGGLAIR
ncbi:MAG: hypothetical protein ACREHV_16685 [Rhizomicrobium sp.]